MSERDAKRMIIVSILVTGSLALARKIINQKKNDPVMPSVRILVGVLFAGFMLSVLAEFSPELAGPLAALLMVTAIFSNQKVFNQLSKIGAS